MTCPKCKRDRIPCTGSRVLGNGTKWRRYTCPQCGADIETMERITAVHDERRQKGEKDTRREE